MAYARMKWISATFDSRDDAELAISQLVRSGLYRPDILIQAAEKANPSVLSTGVGNAPSSDHTACSEDRRHESEIVVSTTVTVDQIAPLYRLFGDSGANLVSSG